MDISWAFFFSGPFCWDGGLDTDTDKVEREDKNCLSAATAAIVVVVVVRT